MKNILSLRKLNSGFTLTEVIISIAILGIITTVIVNILRSIITFNQITTAQYETQQNARICIDLINRNLRDAKGDSVIVDRDSTSQPVCSRIYFKNSKDDEFYFYQTGNKLYMGEKRSGWGGWQTKKISENIKFLGFSYKDTGNQSIISVSLSTEKQTSITGTKTMHMSIEEVRIMN